MTIEHRNAERKRRVGDHTFQAMFMAMDEGAVSRNGSGEIVAVNPAAENILGLAATEWIGRSAADLARALNLIREDETPLPWELDPATLAAQTGMPQRNVLMGAHRPDGTLVWISANEQPLPSDGEYGPYGAVTTFRDVTERKRTEDALWFVAQRGWMDGAENFFDALAQYLGKTLGVDYAVIKRLDEDAGHAETIAIYAKGTIVPNRRFPLQGTPHKKVLERKFCIIPQGIRQLFPEDALLAELDTESYAGLALWDSVGQPIGLISVMCSRPLREESLVSKILHIVAPRVAAELERERNDRILRQREQEFRSLAESSLDSIVRYDRDGRIRYLNSELLRSFGMSATDIVGRLPREVWPDGRYAQIERAIARAAETGEATTVEVCQADATGALRFHQVHVVAERDSAGQIVGALAFGRDITVIRETERKLRHFIENLPGMAYTFRLSPDGHASFPYVSPAIRELYGLEPDDVKDGMAPLHRLVHPDDRARIEAAVAESAQTMTPFRVEYRVCRPGLPLRWLHARSVQERGADGSIIWYGIILDITEHKRAEEALRASELEFRTLAENLPDLLIRYDRDGRRTYVSPAMERTFAVTPEQLIGKTLREVNPTGMAMPEPYLRALEHTLATGERSEFEVQIPRPDGNMLTGLCFIVAERAADGRIVGAIAVSRDISERKRMESEIRRREREFRSLAENSPDPIFRYDRDCRRLYANPASSVMSGHPIESLIGATPGDCHLLAPGNAAKLMVGIHGVFGSGEPGCVDTVSVDRDGRQRNYQVLLVPEPDETGKVATVLGLARDTTAIRDVERRMTDFVANLPGFAFTFRMSPEGHASFPFASPGIESLAGLKPEDVKDGWASALALVHPDDVPHIFTRMAESVRMMTSHELEIRVCRPGLPVRWIGIRSIPLRQTDGSVLWHGIMLDIDERKRNEAELERHRHHLEKLVEDRTLSLSIAKETAEAATRAKSHFLAAASHDLRQPLQAIQLFNDALAKSGLDEKQKKIGLSLSKAVNSLNELLDGLLDLSRLDAGIIEPQPVAIEAEDLLGTIGAEFDAVAREKKLSLNLFCPRQFPALFIDHKLLLSLLRNLVSNAVKYTARGGILVGIRRRGNRALIQVWDTGIGIAPEQMDSIFEDYFQIGNPERHRAKGVGLGLAIVRRLSKLLDVGVRFRSREGKGSVFELSVPLTGESDWPAVAVPASASLDSLAAPRLTGKRIVVVEDDAMAAEALKLSLAMDDARVTLFATAEDALGSAEVIGADYYICDYRLPGMDGLQLLNAIQKNSVEPIKAVMLTGNVSPDQIEIVRSSGWRVLFKPIALSQLLSALDAYETESPRIF